MPTEAFLQLKESKKTKLIDAAVEEFSSTPYDKVSVFKIAAAAGISRSGFYYYFKNKADLYSYIYLVKIRNEFNSYMNSIEEKQDIFTVFDARFQYYLSIKGTENEPLVKQMLQNIKSFDLIKIFKEKTVSLFNGLSTKDELDEEIADNFGFFENFDTKSLATDNREDVLMLAMLMNIMTIKYISSYFDGNITKQEATVEYRRHIGYLKFGFLR